MQIGCDPKADLHDPSPGMEKFPLCWSFITKTPELKLTDMVQIGYGGVVCVEAGGPAPGLMCGRGYHYCSRSLRKTEPMRPINRTLFFGTYWEMLSAVDFPCLCERGYADKVFIITSGENMAIHAGANIAMAVDNFRNRGYASLWRRDPEPAERCRERKKKRSGSWQRNFSYAGSGNAFQK